MKKMINGVNVDCSPEEEALINRYSDLNTAYPEYYGHLMFDGISEPKYDIVQCRKTHGRLITDIMNQKIAATNAAIEAGQEDGKDVTPLFQKRKHYKNFLNDDYTDHLHLDTIEKLDFHLKTMKAID